MRTVLVIFGELTDQDIDWLSATGVMKPVGPGEILIKKGVATSALYVVLSGEFSVWIDEGKQAARAGTGEILGEMSLLEARPPQVTVKAATHSETLVVPLGSLRAKLRDDPGFAGRFYKALAVLLSFRLRRLTYRLHGTEESEIADELDDNILDTVYLAGARFDRMLKRLS